MGSTNPSIHKLSGRYCPHCLLSLWEMISSGVEFCPGSGSQCDYVVSPEGAPPLNPLQVKARKLNAKRLEVDALHNRLRSALETVAAMESDPDWVQFVELAAERLNLPPLTPFQKALLIDEELTGDKRRGGGQSSGMPEHEKRHTADGLHPDVNAAYCYVMSVSDTCDIPSSNAWHGWALREAFLAGVSFADSRPASSEAQPTKFVVEQFLDEKGWTEIPGCSFATKELAVAELEHRERHHKQRDLQVVKVGVVMEVVRREVRDLVMVGLPGEALPFQTEWEAH